MSLPSKVLVFPFDNSITHLDTKLDFQMLL